MFINLLIINLLKNTHYPTVLIHGIGGNQADLNDIENYLVSQNISVYNLEIGNGKFDSIFMNINDQCYLFGQNINALNLSQPKINILGVSQGGLIARCYLEKYSDTIKPIHSLITYGTPHMGIYTSWIELKNLEYWKNPFQYDEYLLDNKFLKYINNEIDHSDYQKYKKNIISLDNFLVVWSSIDTVITPLESSKLEYFNTTQAATQYNLSIVPFKQSQTYINDFLGLRELDINGKLHIEQYDCAHEQFKHPDCFLKKFNNQRMSLIELTMSVL